ncbi:MAG: lipoate--protein ligase family protein [Bacillota bacterium]
MSPLGPNRAAPLPADPADIAPSVTTWRLIRSDPADAARNMAVDEAIMTAHGRGLVPPTLRFYTWQPAAVSIGYFQSLEREIDVETCRRAGFGIVRRLTGGRAVLHDDELTYSITIAESILPGSVLATYRYLSRGLLAGFRLIRVRADLTNPPSRGMAAPHGPSAACFDAPSWYELTAAGKKIVGSAQTRKNGVILQHGAIILGLDLDKLMATLRFPSDQVRERARQTLAAKAGGIDEAAGRRIDAGELAVAMAAGFTAGLGLVLEPGDLTAEELRLADEFERTKYSQNVWNWRK